MELLVLPLLWPLMLVLVLPLGTLLTGAAAVREGGRITAAVDKEVAPVGDVKTDLLSLEQEIGGSMKETQLSRAGVDREHGERRARGLWFSGGLTGYPFGNWGSGYAWSYPGYGYYGGLPYNGNGYGYGYGGIGYYPGYLGYQKIILG